MLPIALKSQAGVQHCNFHTVIVGTVSCYTANGLEK